MNSSRLFYLMCSLVLVAQPLFAQNIADHSGSVLLCDYGVYEVGQMDEGEVNDMLFVQGELCFGFDFQETYSTWLKFSSESKGKVGFNLVPYQSQDDLDFVVFRSNVDSAGALTLEPIRCMASGGILGEVLKSSYSRCLGATGLREGASDLVELRGCEHGDDNYLSMLEVQNLETYYILVNNYNSSNGFQVDFFGNAELRKWASCLTSQDNLEGMRETLSVYPNPASNRVTVKLQNSECGIEELSITDSDGKLCYSKVPDDYLGKNEINVFIGDFPSGAYTVVAKCGNDISSAKFIKIKK